MAPPMLRIQKLITPPGGHFLLANFSQKFNGSADAPHSKTYSPHPKGISYSETFHKSLMAPPMLRIQKLIAPTRRAVFTRFFVKKSFLNMPARRVKSAAVLGHVQASTPLS